jgi:ribosome-binding protein aMBF1 (putative translation factor)
MMGWVRVKHASMRRGRQQENAPLWGVPPPRRKGDDAMLRRLGASIQAQRRARGLTQEKLAEIIDVHSRIVQKIEAGELNPKSTTLIRVQQALACPWEKLLQGV